MPVLYSRTFRWAKDEWYHAWCAWFPDIYALESALRRVWGPTSGGSEQVKVQIRHDYLLEVVFIGLNNHTDEALVASVRQVLKVPPLPQDANALEVVDRIIQEPS